MTADSKKRSETIATPVHDPRLLERAGWTNAEVVWEQIQEAAAECERADDDTEASELWRGGLELAREHLPPGDLRVATSVANVAVAERRPAMARPRNGCSTKRWRSGMRASNGSSPSSRPPSPAAPRFICVCRPSIQAAPPGSRGSVTGHWRWKDGRSSPQGATASPTNPTGSIGGEGSARTDSTTGAGCWGRCS